MYTNAFSISIAGSDGTATALMGAIYLMLQARGDAYRRADAEVLEAFSIESDITSSNVSPSTLPCLDAILHEVMRLYPPVAITFPRRVPEGALEAIPSTADLSQLDTQLESITSPAIVLKLTLKMQTSSCRRDGWMAPL